MAIEYTIDKDALTIGDLITLQKTGGDIQEQIEIVRKCVQLPDGATIEQLPARHLKLIIQACAGIESGN